MLSPCPYLTHKLLVTFISLFCSPGKEECLWWGPVISQGHLTVLFARYLKILQFCWNTFRMIVVVFRTQYWILPLHILDEIPLTQIFLCKCSEEENKVSKSEFLLAHLCHSQYKWHVNCWFCLKEVDFQWAVHSLQILRSRSFVCNNLQ